MFKLFKMLGENEQNLIFSLSKVLNLMMTFS